MTTPERCPCGCGKTLRQAGRDLVESGNAKTLGEAMERIRRNAQPPKEDS